MKVSDKLRELETCAEGAGVRVCYEPMTGVVAGRGGLCKVRGEFRVIMDKRLKPAERVVVLGDALERYRARTQAPRPVAPQPDVASPA